jgi:hypothetical protein
MSLRVEDLSPSDVVRITERAALVAAEYERTRSRGLLADDDRMTLRILSVLAVSDDLMRGRDNDN